MKSSARLKKLALWAVALVGLLLVLLLAMPLWFPWALGPAGKHYGLRYSRYERLGYSRFALSSVLYSNRSTRVEAGRVEGFVPIVWGFKHFQGDTNSTYARAEKWRLTVVASSDVASKAVPSIYTNVQKIATLLGKLDRWIPNAQFTNGFVQVKDQTIRIGDFGWRHGAFQGSVQRQGWGAPLGIEGTLVSQNEFGVKADYAPLQTHLELKGDRSRSELTLDGAVFVRTNRFDLHAQFGKGGTVPQEARFECRSFSIPAQMVKLNSYGNLAGAVAFVWNGTNFTSDAHATASPPSDSKLPPVDVVLKGRGDLRHAEVDQLKIVVPGFQARLSTNVTIPFVPSAPPAVLKISGDLRQQPWIAAQGMLQGEIVLRGNTNVVPRVEFTIVATNFGAERLKADLIAASGDVAWPMCALRELRATVGSNGVAQIATAIDLAKKEIVSGRAQYDGELPEGALGRGYKLRSLSLAADFAGPLTNLHHRAELQVGGFSSSLVEPLNGDITTQGSGRNVHGKGSLRAGESVLRLDLSAKANPGTNDVTINELSISARGQPLLALEKPVSMRVASVALPGVSTSRELNISPLRLHGTDRQINLESSIQWPSRGNCRGQIHAIALDDFVDFIGTKWRGIRFEDVQFASEWQNGPVSLLLVGNGSYAQGPGFTGRGEVRADSNGIILSNITVSSQSAPVVTARGFLPITINPGAATNFIAWRAGERLNLNANMQPDEPFWKRVREVTGIEIVQPQLSVDVSGSWDAPKGSIHATIGRASLNQTNRPVPTVEYLELLAHLDAQKFRLEKFRFLVEKQPVVITAELPLDAEFYRSLAQRKLPDWRRGSARVLIPNAPAAAFARFLPKVLTPMGALKMDVAMQPGGRLDGQISLQNATTQPVGPFGAIRDINTDLHLRGHTIALERFGATIGGEPVQASGTLDVSGSEWMNRELPPFQLKVRGRNLPLVRQPEVIIRSDLDLTLVHGRSNQPVISGAINLRDSFYTSDLESLIPGKVIKPSQRPPYFSVEAEPLAGWRLNCQVKGQDFMKLRTPFFKGTVSADFKLEGTLREPFASGEARVSHGQVSFPFGTLEVNQGLVSVTAANPYRPTIYATARSRRYGYDITMEITGSGDKPVIQFSSVPSLTSEQILLLLTAGEIPRDELTISPQQKAQRFAVFLGQRLLAKLGFGGGEERLLIRSGEDISESGRTTYDVEYKLDKNWSLVGQYDRFNAFNLSVKRRLYSR